MLDDSSLLEIATRNYGFEPIQYGLNQSIEIERLYKVLWLVFILFIGQMRQLNSNSRDCHLLTLILGFIDIRWKHVKVGDIILENNKLFMIPFADQFEFKIKLLA